MLDIEKENFIELLAESKYSTIKEKLIELNDADAAELLEEVYDELGYKNLVIVFRMLPKDMAADVFVYLPYEQQQTIIDTVSDKEVSEIVNELHIDDTVSFLEEMPANVVKRVLKNAKPDVRKFVNQILNYPEDSAGSLMTMEFLDLKKEMTVKEALARIKKIGEGKRNIYNCYVTDNKRVLEGRISIRKILINSEDTLIEDIMYKEPVSVNTRQDQEEVAELFKKYDMNILPVVDNENRLVGIITVDDIIDVMDQEVTEDIEKMAALTPSDEEYLKTNVFTLAKNRILWLFILMISGMINGEIMSGYENVLEAVAVLSAFIPMVMGTAGNAGSQSSTLIIRGIALGEIEMKDMLKVISKELIVGVIVGGLLSIVNFIKVGFFDTAGMKVGVVVSISMFFAVILANILGGALPIIAKKLKIDPALMAAPLVTTIADASTLIVYFYTARILLHI